MNFSPAFTSSIMFIVILLLSILSYQTSAIMYPCDISAACGCSKEPAVTTRIFGGETAVNNSWGWAVTVYLNSTFYCTGTLISSSWVLTAALCVNIYTASDIVISAATSVRLGGKQWRNVAAIHLHPNFNATRATNNLALLRLSTPLNMTDSAISQICLPAETTEEYPPINATVSYSC